VIASRSGQASGIFFPNWSPLVPAGMTQNSSGLLFLMGKLVSSSSGVRRIILSSGNAIDSRERMAIRYNGEKVRDVYLPEWLLIDVTIMSEAENMPRTITLLSMPGTQGVSIKKIFVGRHLAKNLSWKDFSLLSGRFHLEELLHRITGVVKPSWGSMSGGDENIYVADCNMHLGVIDDSLPFPPGCDMADLGRLESFVQGAGLNVERRERPIEEIAETLRMLDCGTELWSEAVGKIIEEERRREKEGPALDFGNR